MQILPCLCCQVLLLVKSTEPCDDIERTAKALLECRVIIGVTWGLGRNCQARHVTLEAPGAQVPRHLAPREPLAQRPKRPRTVGHESHLGHAKIYGYIDGFMERPLWSSMVNSTQ